MTPKAPQQPMDTANEIHTTCGGFARETVLLYRVVENLTTPSRHPITTRAAHNSAQGKHPGDVCKPRLLAKPVITETVKELNKYERGDDQR